MSSKQRKKERWARLNRIKKRRVNLFALSQKVEEMAVKNDQFRDLTVLDSEQTYDLLEALEKKVRDMRTQLTCLKMEVAELKKAKLPWWKKWQAKWRKKKQFPVG